MKDHFDRFGFKYLIFTLQINILSHIGFVLLFLNLTS